MHPRIGSKPSGLHQEQKNPTVSQTDPPVTQNHHLKMMTQHSKNKLFCTFSGLEALLEMRLANETLVLNFLKGKPNKMFFKLFYKPKALKNEP